MNATLARAAYLCPASLGTKAGRECIMTLLSDRANRGSALIEGLNVATAFTLTSDKETKPEELWLEFGAYSGRSTAMIAAKRRILAPYTASSGLPVRFTGASPRACDYT